MVNVGVLGVHENGMYGVHLLLPIGLDPYKAAQ